MGAVGGTRVSDEMCDWHANTQFYLWGIEREARPSVHHHHPPLTTGLLIKAPSVHTRAQASEHTHLHTHINIEMYTHSATQTIKKEGGGGKKTTRPGCTHNSLPFVGGCCSDPSEAACPLWS